MGINKLWELIENVRHFVAALTAADIYNYIRLSPFSKLMLCNGFTASERSRNSGNTALCNWEKSVNYTLTRYKRYIGSKLFSKGASLSYRPFLHESYSIFIAFFICKNTDCIRYFIIALGDFLYFTAHSRRNHYFMVYNICFLNSSNYIAAYNFISIFYAGNKMPHFLSVESRNFYSSLKVIS